MQPAYSKSAKQKEKQVVLAGVKLPPGKFEAWAGLNVKYSRQLQTADEASSLFVVKVMKKRQPDLHRSFESWFIRSGFCAPIYGAPQERINVLEQAKVHQWLGLNVSPMQTPTPAASVHRSISEKSKESWVESARNNVIDSHTQLLDQDRWYGKCDVPQLILLSSPTLTSSSNQAVKSKSSRTLIAEPRRVDGDGDVTFIMEGDLRIDGVSRPNDTRSIACGKEGLANNPNSPLTDKSETAKMQTTVTVSDDKPLQVAGLRNTREKQVLVSQTSQDKGHQSCPEQGSKQGKFGLHKASLLDEGVISDKVTVLADCEIEIDTRNAVNKNLASARFDGNSILTTIQSRIDEADSAIRLLQIQQDQFRHDLNFFARSRYADNKRLARLERERLLEIILSFVGLDREGHWGMALESAASAASVKRDPGVAVNEQQLLQTNRRAAASTIAEQPEEAFACDQIEKGSNFDGGGIANTLSSENMDTVLIVEKASIVAVSSAIARSVVRSDLPYISSGIAAGNHSEKARLDALLSKTQEECALLEQEKSQLVRQLVRERAEAAAKAANMRGSYNKLATQLIREKQHSSAIVRSLRLREREKAMALVSLAANVARSGVRLPTFQPKPISGNPCLRKQALPDPSNDDGQRLTGEDASTVTLETMSDSTVCEHRRRWDDAKGTLGTIQTGSCGFHATGKETSGVAIVDKSDYNNALNGRHSAGIRLDLDTVLNSVQLQRTDCDSATAERCSGVASSLRVTRQSAESTLSLESASSGMQSEVVGEDAVVMTESSQNVDSCSNFATTKQLGLENRLGVQRTPRQLGISTSHNLDVQYCQNGREEHGCSTNDPFDDCTDDHGSGCSLGFSTASDDDRRREYSVSDDVGEAGLVPPSRDSLRPPDVPCSKGEREIIFDADYVVCFARCSFEAITEHEIPMRVNQPFFVRAADIKSGDWVYVHPCPSRDMTGEIRPSGYVPFAYISSPHSIRY